MHFQCAPSRRRISPLWNATVLSGEGSMDRVFWAPPLPREKLANFVMVALVLVLLYFSLRHHCRVMIMVTATIVVGNLIWPPRLSWVDASLRHDISGASGCRLDDPLRTNQESYYRAQLIYCFLCLQPAEYGPQLPPGGIRSQMRK